MTDHQHLAEGYGDASVPCSTKTGAIATKDELDALRARVNALEEAIRDADDEVTIEINPCNYSHDDVCLLNEQATSAILILRAAVDARHDQPDQGGGQ